MSEQQLELKVINSPTIMIRLIEIIKRRRIRIKLFLGEECPDEADDALVRVVVYADEERVRLLKSQFEKQIEVITVKTAGLAPQCHLPTIQNYPDNL